MNRLRVTRIGSALAALALGAGAAQAGPVHDAARRGDGAELVRLLEQAPLLEDRDEAAETPLIAAALAGRTSIRETLIERGALVNARNDRGMTALHAAAFSGNLDAVKMLVEAGADVNDAENKFGVTPLIVAVEEHAAPVAEYLIASGADLEKTERHGYSALTRTAYKGYEDIITLLLENGASCQEIDPVWLADCTRRRTAMGL